jgi:hypothetical protein
LKLEIFEAPENEKPYICLARFEVDRKKLAAEVSKLEKSTDRNSLLGGCCDELRL